MSYSTGFIQQLFNQETGFPNRPLSLRPGVIVYGKVISLYPNQIAELQVGQQKLNAKLSIPLTVNADYWFQVKKGQELPELKVLSSVKDSSKEKNNTIESLLKELSLQNTKHTKTLIASFLKDQLPISKEILLRADKWLTGGSQLPKEITVLKHMVLNELPFTEAVFSSFMQLQTGRSFSELLHALSIELNVYSIKNNPLENLLSSFHAETFSNMEESNQIKQQLAKVINRMGFSYESEHLLSINDTTKVSMETEQLKPLLLELLKTSIPLSTKEIASQLVDKLTGLQLLSQEAGPLLQVVIQIPVSFAGHSMDVTVQYNGKKTKDGKIDSSYCRILVYLDLKHLKETMIDMHIQNRIMNMTIWNNTPLAPLIVDKYSNILKEKMKQTDYTLLTISTKPFSDKRLNEMKEIPSIHFGNSFYKGVDIKI
ncbi:hypothetical protein [Niallia sp. 03133]|uniref:hypothetical protein n=1 Tax=Niallia sp. 03133 TaxID=3458060 RepID=UPI004045157E